MDWISARRPARAGRRATADDSRGLMSSRHARMRAADPPEGIVGGVRGAVSPAPRTRSGREQGGICTALARSITPARASACVALAAIAGLAASQFVDYRTVAIGGRSYSDVAGVAPPPELAAATARSAHGAWALVICGLAPAGLVAGAPRLVRRIGPMPRAAPAGCLHPRRDRPRGLRADDDVPDQRHGQRPALHPARGRPASPRAAGARSVRRDLRHHRGPRVLPAG